MCANEDQLIYMNGLGVGARIKIDFFGELFRNFSENFENVIDIINANHGAFNERQSYGIFVKSIPDEPSTNDFVLTEVSLRRGSEEATKGRVDFFIHYRKWLLLIELKLVRTPITFSEKTEYKRIIHRWNEALEQVNEIPVGENSVLNEFVHRLGAKGIMKVPMIIVIYHENCRDDNEFLDMDDVRDLLEEKFIQLAEQIPDHQYRYYRSIENTWHRTLKTDIHRQLVRGVSFFAGIDNDIFLNN